MSTTIQLESYVKKHQLLGFYFVLKIGGISLKSDSFYSSAEEAEIVLTETIILLTSTDWK